MIPGKTMLLILGAVACSATGQLLLKSGARRLSGLAGLDFISAAVRNVHVLAGLVAWTVATAFWLFVLRVAPLSRAYGLTSLTYVLVLLASMYMLGEQVRRVHIVGTILIVVGIACLLSGD